MEQTAKNTPKAQGGAESRRWGVKEVVTAVLFSALIIVIQISIAAISTINIDVSMVASTAISFCRRAFVLPHDHEGQPLWHHDIPCGFDFAGVLLDGQLLVHDPVLLLPAA